MKGIGVILYVAVDRFDKIDDFVSRCEYRHTIASIVWGCQPALVNGRGDLAPKIADGLTNVNAP